MKITLTRTDGTVVELWESAPYAVNENETCADCGMPLAVRCPVYEETRDGATGDAFCYCGALADVLTVTDSGRSSGAVRTMDVQVTSDGVFLQVWRVYPSGRQVLCSIDVSREDWAALCAAVAEVAPGRVDDE